MIGRFAVDGQSLCVRRPAADDHNAVASRFRLQLRHAATPNGAESALPAPKAVGVLSALSESCMQKARELAATAEYSDTYDNVNILDKIAEQILGRSGVSAVILVVKRS